jgi:hypothetical protein
MAIAVLVLVAIIMGSFYARSTIKADPWADRMLLDKGMDMPVLWLYYDNSQVNSRQWYDFGTRSSRILNMPFMTVVQNQWFMEITFL